MKSKATIGATKKALIPWEEMHTTPGVYYSERYKSHVVVFDSDFAIVIDEDGDVLKWYPNVWKDEVFVQASYPINITVEN